MRSGKRVRPYSLLASLVLFGLIVGSAGAARADIGPFWRGQGDKAGPWMFNLKTGGAFSGYVASGYGYDFYGYPHYFVAQFEAGYALDRNRNAYLIFPPQFEFAPGLTVVMLPFGFQYDIPMPIRGLYIYPRAIAGFAAFAYHGYYRNVGIYAAETHLAGFIAPEFGVKYVLKGRLNFGIDGFSLPIFFGSNGAQVQFRVSIYAGINI